MTEPLTDEQLRALLAKMEAHDSWAYAGRAWLKRLLDERAWLLEQLTAAREKNGELNRRCQAAEGAARQTVEQARRAGGSFGRSLANYAARLYERERDEARAAAVRVAMHAAALPPELALLIDGWRLELETARTKP